MSAAATGAAEVLSPDIVYLRSDLATAASSATTSSSIQGYTPAQVRKAYGFDSVSFSNTAITANGAGQTIAIVDAFNDPNLQADLKVFDAQFSLSSASLKVVNQSGGSSLPTTDSGWAGEISLDVEWAHAVAPAANILLVEANSDSISDLMSAVNYARHAAGVSVVSMSWGGSEFFSWNGGEFSSQTNYDPFFTTPSGHQGVTFVAAAGDSGSFSGVQWPASSPNVLSVGGTSLNTSDSAGTYLNESSWSGTSGGYSQVEAEPSYQLVAQTTGARATPDVSYDGDPNTGFAVYDSLPDQGYSGWQEVGGTSAGAPQWAALVAIADQGRVAAGLTTLDGATQTLPLLYGLYAAPDAAGYSTYTSDFNDVIDSTGGGGGGRWHWRWGGYGSGNSATAGYDTATGLGSPKAPAIVDALIGTANTTNAGSTTSGSSGSAGTTTGTGVTGGSTMTAALPASTVIGTILNAPAASVVGGTSGMLKVRLTNTASTRFAGPITITLYASPDGSLSDATEVTTMSLAQVNLRSGAQKTVKLKFDYPSEVADGSYTMIATIDATGTGTAPAEADAPASVTIAAPAVDLAATFNGTSVRVTPGKGGSATLVIQNLGNVTAVGTIGVNLYTSTNTTLDNAAQLLTTLATRNITLRAGRSITLHLHFTAPADQLAGAYNLLAQVISSTQPTDNNAANDVASIGTTPA